MDNLPDGVIFLLILIWLLIAIIGVLAGLVYDARPKRTVYRQPGEPDEKYLERIRTAGDAHAMLEFLEEKNAHSNLQPKIEAAIEKQKARDELNNYIKEERFSHPDIRKLSKMIERAR